MMEAATVASPQAPPDPEQAHDGEAEATRSTEELFQWSRFVHVPSHVSDCEHAVDGECKDPKHFHAWVCVPNSLQVRDIVDKARAAKARKSRAMRGSSSDAYEVLEAELDELRREHYDELVQATARANVEKVLADIIRELQTDERFEHHGQDTEEFRRLDALPEDERDAEEYERLKADVLAYGEAMQKEIESRVEREVTRLRGLPAEEVVELERRARIENESTEVYLHTYYLWATYVGTRTTGLSSTRKFKHPDELKNAAPEVTLALRQTMRELEERTMARGDAAGNS